MIARFTSRFILWIKSNIYPGRNPTINCRSKKSVISYLDSWLNTLNNLEKYFDEACKVQ